MITRAGIVIVAIVALATPARADLAALGAALPVCEPARATCLGIAIHVAVDDGGPVAAPAWLAAQLAAASFHFARLDVGFEVVSIDALPARAARVEDRRERDAFGPAVTGPVLHVFVTGQLDDIDRAGEVVYGVAWRRGSTKFIILSTQARDLTLAHELGHVFGLPHSTHAISIMNKTPRTEPPPDQRTFADEEYARMGPRIRALLRTKALTNRRK